MAPCEALNNMKTSMESVGEGDSYATKSADYTKLLTVAKAHKLALVVMTLIKAKIPPEEQQKGIRAEIKEARKAGIKEKEALPMRVYEKAMKLFQS